MSSSSKLDGLWPYSCSLWVVDSRICKDQRITSSCIPNKLFSMPFVSVQVVQLYSSTDIATALKKTCFILSERSDFPIINNLSSAFHVRMLTSLSEDEILLPRYTRLSFFKPSSVKKNENPEFKPAADLARDGYSCPRRTTRVVPPRPNQLRGPVN